MASGLLHCVARLPHVSGLPEDETQNTFNFAWVETDVAAAVTKATSRIHAFYTDIEDMPHQVGEYLNEAISRVSGACTIECYNTTDLSGATPLGSPVAVETFTMIDAYSSSFMPAEVALCSSYHGDLTDIPESSGGSRPAARRRGRIYLGPLIADLTTVLDSTTKELRASAGLVADVVAASASLADFNDTTAWCVWSKADAAEYPIVGGFVDNAFDTQRRRGPAASSRSTWALP